MANKTKRNSKGKTVNKVGDTHKSAKPKKPQNNNVFDDIHEKFMKQVGLYIYAYARSQGYSVLGAKFFLALAAQEAGYNKESSFNYATARHNYFGDMRGSGSKHNLQVFKTDEEGIGYEMQKDTGLIHRSYPLVDKYLRIATATGSQEEIDKAFRAYNGDPNGKNYVSWLQKQDVNGVTQRAITATNDELSDIQKQEDTYTHEIGALFMMPPPFNLLQQKKIKSDIDELKKLDTEKSFLQHIQQELQTGMPSFGNWFNMGDTAAPVSKPSLIGPTPPVHDSLGGQQGWPNSIRYLVNPDEGDYLPQAVPSAKPGISASASHGGFVPISANTMPSASQVSASGSVSGGAGGKSAPVNNIHIQPSHTVNNHSANSSKNIHDEVVAILTSAVADAKIGTDIH